MCHQSVSAMIVCGMTQRWHYFGPVLLKARLVSETSALISRSEYYCHEFRSFLFCLHFFHLNFLLGDF